MNLSARFSPPSAKALTATLLILSAVPALFAQSYSGGVRGAVSDQQGSSIAGAKVTLSDDKTGTSRSLLSNDSGGYDFASLVPSTYTLVAMKPGFKQFERNNGVLGTQENLTVDQK